MDYKSSGLDVSPLLALNHTWPYQKLISLNHPNVKEYVQTLIEKNKEIYKVNTTFQELGVAIGRYPEDKYDGCRPDRKGSPWFLATLALGEHYCLAGQKGNLVEKQFQPVLFHSDRKAAYLSS